MVFWIPPVANVQRSKMDESILVKLVWLGAITAIPVAVLAVQKPRDAPR